MTGEQMSLEEYAAVQASFGAKIVGRHGFYWRRVRPLFYRPLLPLEQIECNASDKAAVWPSITQYPTTKENDANSTLNYLMLYNPESYSLSSLSHKRRQMITRASKSFTVRRITTPQELKDCGHQTYLSFYHRTGYRYKAERRDKIKFERWVDRLFSQSKVLVMGGFSPDGMGAVSTSYWVKQTLIYSSLICDSNAMKRNIGEVMLHELRLLASSNPGIRQIYVRNYQGGNSIDQYYLLRGCTLIRQPAKLEAPMSLLRLLKFSSASTYNRLLGSE